MQNLFLLFMSSCKKPFRKPKYLFSYMKVRNFFKDQFFFAQCYPCTNVLVHLVCSIQGKEEYTGDLKEPLFVKLSHNRQKSWKQCNLGSSTLKIIVQIFLQTSYFLHFFQHFKPHCVKSHISTCVSHNICARASKKKLQEVLY